MNAKTTDEPQPSNQQPIRQKNKGLVVLTICVLCVICATLAGAVWAVRFYSLKDDGEHVVSKFDPSRYQLNGSSAELQKDQVPPGTLGRVMQEGVLICGVFLEDEGRAVINPETGEPEGLSVDLVSS